MTNSINFEIYLIGRWTLLCEYELHYWLITFCVFQHRRWVQCLWFLRRDVLITQTTFECSNIGGKSSASDFSGGMSWSLKQPLHMFQHRMWVQLVQLGEMLWSFNFEFSNIACEFNNINFFWVKCLKLYYKFILQIVSGLS